MKEGTCELQPPLYQVWEACVHSFSLRVCVCVYVYNVSVFLPSWTEPEGRESSLSATS